MDVRILGMAEREMLSELRDWRIDGIPSSGFHRASRPVLHVASFLTCRGSLVADRVRAFPLTAGNQPRVTKDELRDGIRSLFSPEVGSLTATF